MEICAQSFNNPNELLGTFEIESKSSENSSELSTLYKLITLIIDMNSQLSTRKLVLRCHLVLITQLPLPSAG
jgi:hypothetical protein